MKYKLIIMTIFFGIYAGYLAYFCHEADAIAKEEGQEIYEDKFCSRYPKCTMLHEEDGHLCAAHEAEYEQKEYDYWHADPDELEEKAAWNRENWPDVEWRQEEADRLEDRAKIIRKRSFGNKSSKNKKHISSSSSKNNRLDYDPDDYDTPEDYADDAVGNDFDEWEDAYEYWEEVE